MIMKKIYFVLFVSFLSQIVLAQDVIVKRDGSTILSKVLEVNTDDVKYKKFSNLNGPTYTIKKSELFSINYKNGEKDMFDGEIQSNNNNLTVKSTVAFGDNPRQKEENLALVREFNSHDPIYQRTDFKEDWESLVFVYGIKEGSILDTPELSASFAVKRASWRDVVSLSSTDSSLDFVLMVTLKNKSDKTVFIDQGTSYVIFDGYSQPYYVPSATSTTSGSSSGVGVNMGAVAGALGIGGALGTLAGGINVGEGSSSSSSQITFSQRVISIPPKCWVTLPAQGLMRSSMVQPYLSYFLENNIMKELKKCYRFQFEGLKCGQKYNLPPMYNLNPMAVHITYSLDESTSSTRNLHVDFYLRQIMGTRIAAGNHLYKKGIDFKSCPVCFFTCSPGIRASDLDIPK